MAIDIDEVQEFSDEGLLKLYRWGLARNAAGSSTSYQGRSVQFPPLKEMMEMITWLEGRINSQTDTSGGTAVVKFEDPV